MKNRGQVLVGVIIVMLALIIIIPAVVEWTQQEARVSVKDQKSTVAFNLAEAAVSRGYWEAKSSTGTFAQIQAGIPLAGYNFDATYADVSGGTYRISLSSAANSSVEILGEGRDNSTNEVREIEAVYQNRTIYSPLLTQGDVNYSKGLCLYWGPIMSQGNITLDATTAQWYFPRKFARGDVVGTAAYPRDTTWPLPPNTDGVEWWANYQQVPELPILDFATLRAEAAASNTLNVYGCVKSSYGYRDPATGNQVSSGKATWEKNSTSNENCSPSANVPPNVNASINSSVTYWFGDSYEHPKGVGGQGNGVSISSYVWYWDGNLVLTGRNSNWYGLGNPTPYDTGLYGTVIVMGNLTIESGGDYAYTGEVPADAWQEHERLLKNTYDTAASLEYPADAGYHKTSSTWKFGTQTFSQPGQGSGWYNTVGIRGFVYVGGNLYIKSFMDFNGAIWVKGSVNATCPSGSNNCTTAFCGVFYNDQLSVPSLNVVLVQTSWQEVQPNMQTWN